LNLYRRRESELTRNEIDQLFLEKKRKGITNKSLSQIIGCSEGLISSFFNHRCNLSFEKELFVKKLIQQAKEYRYLKVEIED
jgi:hypothetical protein